MCACEFVYTFASYYVAWTLHSLLYTVVTVVYNTTGAEEAIAGWVGS